MLKNNILLGFILSFILFAPFANAAYFFEDKVTCSKLVRGDSSFACLTRDQVVKYTGYQPAKSPFDRPAGTYFSMNITNTGTHAFRLHGRGELIKPGETKSSVIVKYVPPCYWTRHPYLSHQYVHCNNPYYDDIYDINHGLSDSNEVKIYRGDSLLSSRTLSAEVTITYSKNPD